MMQTTFPANLLRQLGLCLLLTGIAPSLTRAADVTFNITLLGQSDPLAGSLVYGDVWAENGYAYVGSDVNAGGMNIFSISNPANPIFLERYPGDQFEDVEVWDGIGYFGSDTNVTTGTGVDIVDLSIPFDPVMISRVNGSDCISAGVCAHNKVHTLSVAKTNDNRLFLYTTDNATDVVKITNVTDPANPQLVTSLDLGLGPTTGPTTNIASHEIIVRNNRMYVASKDNNFNTCCGWASIYDVADPANPVLIKKFESGARSHTALPSDDGKLLIVAEERPDGNVKIYDISNITAPNDPDNPILLATLNRTNVGIDAHSPHHPHLHGNLLFLSWYEAGLQVFNISDPSNPVHVGAFDTYVGTSTSYAGNWGNDFSLGLKNVFLSDRGRGLIAVDARGVVIPGDYNQDMVVDQADYEVWLASLGTNSSGLHTPAFADGNYDGIVNAADYTVWRDHLGQTGPWNAPGGAALNGGYTITRYAVPEPTVLLLAAFVALAAAFVRTGSRG
jgi:hypothetical protein